jgi:tetratricopeptide (TPR) repeat protein
MKGARVMMPAVVLVLFMLTVSPVGAQSAQERAIAGLDAAIAKRPGDAVAHYYRGRAYAAAGRFDLAMGDFTRAIELNGNFAAAYLNRGYVYARLAKDGASDKAIEDFSEALRVDPGCVPAYASRAWQYNRKQEYDAAILDCARALAIDRGFTRVYFTKAYAHEKRFEYEEAIATLRALMAVSDDPREIAGARSLIRSLGGVL